MKLVHAHTVEGLYWRALGLKVPPALKDELRELGLDLEGKPRDIEHEPWVKMLAATVRHLYPRLSVDDGYYQLGDTIMRGYESTIMGKALFAMMRMLGPHRVLKRASSSLRSGNTYSDAKVTELGGNHYEVWTNECNGSPHYLRGIFFSALTRAGAKGVSVKVLSYDGHAATFDINWT